MTRNPILEEIYAARTEILAEYQGDLGAYLRSANERMQASGHQVANVTQRTIRRTGASKSGISAVGNPIVYAPQEMLEQKEQDA